MLVPRSLLHSALHELRSDKNLKYISTQGLATRRMDKEKGRWSKVFTQGERAMKTTMTWVDADKVV